MIGPMINPSFGSDQTIPSIAVTEACETLVNGTYVLTGIHNSQPYWYNGDTYLYYDGSGYWCIDGTLGTAYTSALYVVQNLGPWPPENYSWEARTGCTPGLPSLRYLWILPGPEPTTCPDEEPEIVLTVTGSTGTINWCGETWNLPGDSGVAKTVCPTNFVKKKEFSSYIGSFSGWRVWSGSNIWGIPNQLELTRGYKIVDIQFGTFYAGYASNLNKVNLNNGLIDNKGFKRTGNTSLARPIPVVSSVTADSDLGLVLSVTAPSYSSYSITGEFFGSYDTGTVVYAWAKGNGWPGPVTT